MNVHTPIAITQLVGTSSNTAVRSSAATSLPGVAVLPSGAPAPALVPPHCSREEERGPHKPQWTEQTVRGACSSSCSSACTCASGSQHRRGHGEQGRTGGGRWYTTSLSPSIRLVALARLSQSTMRLGSWLLLPPAPPVAGLATVGLRWGLLPARRSCERQNMSSLSSAANASRSPDGFIAGRPGGGSRSPDG